MCQMWGLPLLSTQVVLQLADPETNDTSTKWQSTNRTRPFTVSENNCLRERVKLPHGENENAERRRAKDRKKRGEADKERGEVTLAGYETAAPGGPLDAEQKQKSQQTGDAVNEGVMKTCRWGQVIYNE